MVVLSGGLFLMSEVPLNSSMVVYAVQGYLANKKQSHPLGPPYDPAGYLAHKKTPTPLGTPQGPGYGPTAGS